MFTIWYQLAPSGVELCLKVASKEVFLRPARRDGIRLDVFMSPLDQLRLIKIRSEHTLNFTSLSSPIGSRPKKDIVVF